EIIDAHKLISFQIELYQFKLSLLLFCRSTSAEDGTFRSWLTVQHPQLIRCIDVDILHIDIMLLFIPHRQLPFMIGVGLHLTIHNLSRPEQVRLTMGKGNKDAICRGNRNTYWLRFI